MSGWVAVLGATSAIGRALALEYAGAGHDIVLAGRDLEELRRIACDVRVRTQREVAVLRLQADAFDTHAEFHDQLIEVTGGALAGACLCFGYMTDQATAQSDFEAAQRTIDVTYTGAVSVLNRLADYLEGRGSGFLAVLSSVAGERGRQSNYVYGSAKAALTAFCAGLRVRLFKAGVTVTTVKPGFVDTKMTYGLPGLFLVADPADVARRIRAAVDAGQHEVYTPWFWRWIMLIIKCIPDFVFKRMKM